MFAILSIPVRHLSGRTASEGLRNGAYPPLRGTFLELEQGAVLYSRGSVPYFRTYPDHGKDSRQILIRGRFQLSHTWPTDHEAVRFGQIRSAPEALKSAIFRKRTWPPSPIPSGGR